MCNFGHHHEGDRYGFIVDTPEIRQLIGEVRRFASEIESDAERVEALRPAFSKLLAAEGWLPHEYGEPDRHSGMGGGIGQYALYRSEDGSLCLFSLVIPAGASTPVHDHLAWGLVGVYRGEQAETVYRRLDDGHEEGRADLEVSKELKMSAGEFYTLLPPTDDIHYVTTISEQTSVSIHLLANDTACVWRHRFHPEEHTVTAFRSGYSNAPCPPEKEHHPHHHDGVAHSH
jgi:predicted metal-dependent enzyme (double-stranded beta helix superfamily)